MINWNNVSDAINRYNDYGYKYIEVPWLISKEALDITLPPNKKGLWRDKEALVGSAEQGFLQMMLDGTLSPGKYVSASPCFRDEDVIDDLHQRYFFKVELIHFSKEPFAHCNEEVMRMLYDAKSFYDNICLDRTKIVKTDQGYDLELCGIELGSYGYRSHENFHWIYGTGYADPRFSHAELEELKI